ncbi:MAG: DNA-directed RNA polymerase subunit omega [Ruminococcaceae bacterium]|jgi:DNA-directed RNA polymerase omega subunit|nr:DNA-directed RNA polymerase subunit omega [Oscillospiraceae bacterium]
MMLYPSMSDLLKKIPNRYALVNVAAKRARDIAARAEEDTELHLEEKPVSMALDDIMNDRIVPAEPKEEAETMTEQAEETAEDGEQQ